MDRVTYKPLASNLSSEINQPNSINEHNQVEIEEDDDGDEFEDELFSRSTDNYRHNTKSPFNDHYSLFSTYTYKKFNLNQLRILLYLLALLLFLIFVAQLSQSESDRDARSISANSMIIMEKLGKNPSQLPSSISARTADGQNHPIRPQYDSYLSSVLKEGRNSMTAYNGSDTAAGNHRINDDLLYDIKANENQSSVWWLLNFRDDYVTVTNYIRAMKSFNYNSSVTLTSQATTEFMYHTLELCKRWDGPISVAVFSPGSEMLISTTLIKFMRQCLPKPLSACIRDKVTWHLVYNKHHGPTASTLSYPRSHLDINNHPLFVNQDLCPKLLGPEPSDLIKQFESQLKKENGLEQSNYRQLFQLTYPINVLRNTARLAASTKYVLASDIELYPSVNLVASFINYMNRHDVRKEFPQVDRYDFTLPIFEIDSSVLNGPKTKEDLIKLIEQKKAIFFHKWVCDACQNFPHRLDWLQTNTKLTNLTFRTDEITIFDITQRNKSRDSWEPIFIGTNDDPLYDDRLSWDGRRDKMSQMYEMCLLDYYHLIIGNAFLVHAPGIKHIDKNETMKRMDQIRQNNAIYDKTISKLKEQYSSSRNLNNC